MPDRSARALAASAVALAAFGAVIGASPEPTTPSSTGFSEYRAALDRLAPLGNVVFEYTESRSGPTHAIGEDHRVYRNAAGAERNETIAVNGVAVVPAIVRYLTRDAWPYDVRQFAVDTAVYNVMFIGPTTVAGRHVLGYSTVRATVGDFSVTGLYLDPNRHLPVRETFESIGSGCHGSGSIDFESAGGHWLPASVTVSCAEPAGGATYKETIKFTAYQFPAAIPTDVFGAGP